MILQFEDKRTITYHSGYLLMPIENGRIETEHPDEITYLTNLGAKQVVSKKKKSKKTKELK